MTQSKLSPQSYYWYSVLWAVMTLCIATNGWNSQSLGSACWCRWSIYSWALRASYTLHFEQLWVSALTTNYFKKKIIGQKLRVTQMYGHKHAYLECTLTACPLGNRTAVGFPLQGLWSPILWVCSNRHEIPPVRQPPYPIRKKKKNGYLIIQSTVAPAGIYVQKLVL